MDYKINEDGDKSWSKEGKLHREDGPALECVNGDKHWYKEGKLHRLDAPAIEYSDGEKYWFLNDEIHREDGPAIEYADGSKFWYKENELHREDGPACENIYGDKKWYVKGKLHREDGPACEFAGALIQVLCQFPVYKKASFGEATSRAQLQTHQVRQRETTLVTINQKIMVWLQTYKIMIVNVIVDFC